MTGVLAPPEAARPRPYADRFVADGPRPLLVVAAVVVAALALGASALVSVGAPLLLAGAALSALAAYQRPVVAGVLVVAVCPAISGLQRVGVGPLKASELLLALAASVVWLRLPSWGSRLGGVDRALLGLAACGAVLGAVHVLDGSSSVPSFLRVGLQPLLLLLTWWTASRSVRSATDLRRVVRWALLVSTVPSALALAQTLDLPGVRALLITLTGGPSLAQPGAAELTRATGPFPIWHSLAAYVLVVVVVSLVLLLRPDQQVLGRGPLLLVAALGVGALMVSVTVTVVLWTAVAVLVVSFLQGRLLPAVLLLGVAGALVSVVFSAQIADRVTEQSTTSVVSVGGSTLLPQTLAYRLSVWDRDYLPLVEQAVPYGISNDLPDSALFRHAENQYLLIVLRGGVLLLLATAVAVGAVALGLLRTSRGRRDLPGTLAGALFGVVLFLPVAAMIWPYLTNAGFPQAFLSLAGATAGATARRAVR